MRVWTMLTIAVGLVASPAMSRERVIYDNDWSVTNGGYVSESSLMLLLTDPHIEVVGLTSVSGDFWRDEGVATLLRFLEVIGADDMPVYNGAMFPLVNNAKRHAAWEARFGKTYWAGAWNDIARDKTAHPDDPLMITPPREGLPRRLKPQGQSAVAFMIDVVHRYPHEITIYAEGPLTNIALAIRQDPDFARLAKRIVIQGSAAATDHDDGSTPAEFNFLFDPEAADIVLTAPWADAVVLGDVSNRTVMTKQIAARIAGIDTPAARFASANMANDLPLWSQIGAAIIVDPALITAQVRTVIDVDLRHGRLYGRTRTFPAGSATAPRLGQRVVTLVTKIDSARLVDDYVLSLGKPLVNPHGVQPARIP